MIFWYGNGGGFNNGWGFPVMVLGMQAFRGLVIAGVALLLRRPMMRGWRRGRAVLVPITGPAKAHLGMMPTAMARVNRIASSSGLPRATLSTRPRRGQDPGHPHPHPHPQKQRAPMSTPGKGPGSAGRQRELSPLPPFAVLVHPAPRGSPTTGFSTHCARRRRRPQVRAFRHCRACCGEDHAGPMTTIPPPSS